MSSSPSPSSPSPSSSVREEQVLSALQFFANPKVIASPLSRKLRFLDTKGLTPTEMLEAVKRHYGMSSKEYQLLEKGIRDGQSPAQAVASLDDSATTTTATSTTTTTTATTTPVTQHAHQPQYQPTPTHVPGSSYYPVLPPPQPAQSSPWKTVALTTAGLLGGLAAAGVAAHKVFGFEISRSKSGLDGSTSAGSVSGNVSLTSSTDGSHAASSSTTPMKSSLVPSIPTDPSSSMSSSSLTVGTADHRFSTAASARTTDDDTPTDDDITQERYLGAWLGESHNSRRNRRIGPATTESLEFEVRLLGEKLDQVIESLRENQLELRKLSAHPPPTTDVTRMEQLLTQSSQTQTDMLATLKIMMSAQARASKEAAATAAAATQNTITPSAASSSNSTIPTAPLSATSSAPSMSPSANSLFAPLDPALTSSSQSDVSHPSSTTVPSSSASNPFSFDEIDIVGAGVKNLESQLRDLRANNPPDEVKLASNAMMLYIENLLNNISQPRYRKILLTNSTYVSRVRKVKGAEQYLLAAGFEMNPPYIEWVLPGGNDASSTSSGMDSPSPPLSMTNLAGIGSVAMDENQKTRLLQEALALLKKPPTVGEESNKSFSSAPSTVTSSNVGVPFTQTQAPPSTSFSAYATTSNTSAATGSSNTSPGQTQQLAMNLTAANPTPPVESLNQTEEISSFSTSEPAHTNGNHPTVSQSPPILHPSPQQPSAVAHPYSTLSHTSLHPSSNSSSASVPVPSQSAPPSTMNQYPNTQPFSYPNTPAHGYGYGYGMQPNAQIPYHHHTQSYPNTPLGPPHITEQANGVPSNPSSISTNGPMNPSHPNNFYPPASLPPPAFPPIHEMHDPHAVDNGAMPYEASGIAHSTDHLFAAANKVNMQENAQSQPKTVEQ